MDGGLSGLDVEETLTCVGVKMADHGDAGVKKEPDERKDGERVEGPGHLTTKVQRCLQINGSPEDGKALSCACLVCWIVELRATVWHA